AVREKPELRSMYGLVQASTFDNEKNLPDDYIPSLQASYPPEDFHFTEMKKAAKLCGLWSLPTSV
ncbi:hypothetical protein PT227_25610, partial [Klebsiella pneumoniae]|uniref:hypothetical protein n=1 Tax=Klebsiella pneumoniae TaxID=573 RepID=UPI002363ED86